MARPIHKKSVSFSDSQSKPVATNEEQHFQIPLAVQTLPIHLIILVYSIFTSDSPNLEFHGWLLISTQALYTTVFLNNITETRKSKVRQVKFSVKEYTLLIFALMACVAAVVPLYVGLVLFGAPFTTLKIETLYLALHLSLLAYPAVVAVMKLNKGLLKLLIPIAVGAWLGAIAIPLDWDRPWQEWPLPILGGAYAGAAVTYTVGGYFL